MTNVDHYWVYQSKDTQKEYSVALENSTCDPNDFDRIKPAFDNSIGDFISLYQIAGLNPMRVEINGDLFNIRINRNEEITINPRIKY